MIYVLTGVPVVIRLLHGVCGLINMFLDWLLRRVRGEVVLLINKETIVAERNNEADPMPIHPVLNLCNL